MFPTSLPKYEPYQINPKKAFQRDFQLSNVTYHENWNVDMHLHNYCEVIVVASGNAMHYISGTMVPIVAGDILVIPKNMEHGYRSGENFSHYTINLHDRFFEKYMLVFQGFSSFYALFEAEPIMRGHSRLPLHLKLTQEQLDMLLPLLDKATKYYMAFTPLRALMSDTLVSSILAALCNFYNDNLPPPQYRDENFVQIISMIHEKYNERISVEMLAEKACVSRSTFIKKFTEITGMPPHDYITKIRIAAARDMLISTQYSISKIAVMTGFYDSNHLSRVFEKKCGISPGTYRKQIKK